MGGKEKLRGDIAPVSEQGEKSAIYKKISFIRSQKQTEAVCAVIPLILFSLKWQCGVFSIQWQAVFPTLLLLPVKWLCLLAGLGNGVTLGSLSLLSSSSYPAAADNCSLWKSSGTPTVKQPNQHQTTDKGSLTFSGRQKRNSEWMLMLLYICWMCTVNGQSEHVHQKSITGVKIHAVSQQRQLKLHYLFLALRKKMTWLKKISFIFQNDAVSFVLLPIPKHRAMLPAGTRQRCRSSLNTCTIVGFHGSWHATSEACLPPSMGGWMCLPCKSLWSPE